MCLLRCAEDMSTMLEDTATGNLKFISPLSELYKSLVLYSQNVRLNFCQTMPHASSSFGQTRRVFLQYGSRICPAHRVPPSHQPVAGTGERLPGCGRLA